jgi:hypothetical protein
MMKKIARRITILNVFFTAAVVFLVSCAAQRDVRQDMDPILGEWKTSQNIVLTVHRLEGSELVAEMTSAPGFFSTDLGAGSMIVRNIQPLAPGKYSGLFAMPGDEKPIKVTLRFVNRNAVVVDTGDRRAQGNKMLWQRMLKPAAPKP